jgi:hypothetical protein
MVVPLPKAATPPEALQEGHFARIIAGHERFCSRFAPMASKAANFVPPTIGVAVMKSMIGKLGTMTAVAMLVVATPAIAGKPTGSPKPSDSVVAVLGFDADWTQNTPNGAVHPAACQTEAHLAGPNEVAIVNMNGFLAPSGATNNFLQLKAAVSVDGWPFEPVSDYYTIDGMTDGAAQVGTSKSFALEDGATYVFAAQFQTGFPQVSGFSTCHGTVMVVRLAP